MGVDVGRRRAAQAGWGNEAENLSRFFSIQTSRQQLVASTKVRFSMYVQPVRASTCRASARHPAGVRTRTLAQVDVGATICVEDLALCSSILRSWKILRYVQAAIKIVQMVKASTVGLEE